MMRRTGIPNRPKAAMRALLLAHLLLAFALAGCASKPPRYLMGAYRFPDGGLISIRASKDNTLRCRRFGDGESRRLYRHRRLRYVSGDGFSVRTPVKLVVDFTVSDEGRATSLKWEPSDGEQIIAERVGAEEWVTFPSGDLELFGRIDLPPGEGPHPAIVLVHGSGDDAATDYFFAGDFFAPHGIATLTFDKRGTGRSEGEYTFDFHALAGDVLAAVGYLKSRSDIDSTRIGLSGYSQGGWVGPLAASMTDDISFVLVNYGMIESPAEEARLETRALMRKRGVDEESLAEIDELTLAAVKVIHSGFKEWEEFDAVKSKYKHAEWRRVLKGTPVHDLLKYPHFIVKLIGPLKAPKDLDWYYDSTDVLRELETPVVWLLGEMDESAPNKATIAKIKEMSAEGKRHELILFPGADHSMLVFREEDGERVYTGYAEDYFTTQVDRARRLSGLD